MVGVALLVASSLRAFGRVTVTGDSMRPTLEEGDCLVVLRLGSRWRLRAGALVTVRDPRPDAGDRVLVKRVADLGPRSAALAGDNPERSTDSRAFGQVPLSSVTGRAFYRYAPPGRTGRVR